MRVCGTRLEAYGRTFTDLAPNSQTPTTPTGQGSPVRQSVIPASMTFAAAMARHLEVVRILTDTGCTNDPVIVVDPVTAFRTVSVARGRNGGIAGITLAQLSDKVPTTVRAYRNAHLVGQIVLNQPVTPPPPSPPPLPTPTVRVVCLKQPMICFLKTFPPKAH